jgi:hypothetical protein
VNELPPDEWVSDLTSEIARSRIDKSVDIIASKHAPGGAQFGDAATVNAIITGGAQVLTGLITALTSVYVASKAKTKTDTPALPQPLLIIIQGAGDTARVPTDTAAVRDLDIQQAIAGIGQIRAISIHSR